MGWSYVAIGVLCLVSTRAAGLLLGTYLKRERCTWSVRIVGALVLYPSALLVVLYGLWRLVLDQ